MFGDVLTHWGRRTHICVAYLTIIGSDNGLSPSRRQVIIWTNAGILLIRPFGTYFSEILITIETFSFKKMHLKISSAKWRPFCLGFNVLKLVAIIPGLYENRTQSINYLPGSFRDTCYGSISPYQLLMKMTPRESPNNSSRQLHSINSCYIQTSVLLSVLLEYHPWTIVVFEAANDKAGSYIFGCNVSFMFFIVAYKPWLLSLFAMYDSLMYDALYLKLYQ